MASLPVSAADNGAAALPAPRWLVLACGSQRFGLPLSWVREILPPLPATRIPGCDGTVHGLIGLRGRVLTAFDFGAVLGVGPAAATSNHRLILLEGEGLRAAFAVDEVVTIARVAAAELSLDAAALKALGAGRSEVVGVATVGGQPFLALDPAVILKRLLAHQPHVRGARWDARF
jgi:purine-binding chemotaxis protein CheW